jgi:hypothetical protein
MNHRALSFTVAVFAAATIGSAAEDAKIERLFGGSSAIAVVAAAERVEVATLTIDWEAPKESGMVYRAGEFQPLEAHSAKAIGDLLISPHSYDWQGRANDVIADYHIRVRFVRRDETVEADLSFYSDTLKVRTNGKVSVETFTAGSDALFAEFLRVLANDEHMRRLVALREKWKNQRKRANQSLQPTAPSGRG